MQAVIEVDGNDTVIGPGASDAVVVVTGTGSGVTFGGRGASDLVQLGDDSTVWGGGGGDVLIVGAVSVVRGEDGNDHIQLGSGSRANGDGGHDVLLGLGAGVIAFGGAGNDQIRSDHQITALGGAGDDTVRSGGAGSFLDGGDGNDHVGGNVAGVPEQENSQQDRFVWHYGGGTATLRGGAGDDRIVMDAGDRARGGTGTDHFIAFERPGDAGTIFDLDPAAGERCICGWIRALPPPISATSA